MMIVLVITVLTLGSLLGVTPSVDGASCTTTSTCQATDYTLSSCTSNICKCFNGSFTAIRTGCALNLDKPVIKAISGRTNQVMESQEFKLTCVVSGAQTYEWYMGTNKLNEKTDTFTQTGASTTNVGSFTCKGITADGAVISESSDPFKVELLGASGSTTSSIQPTVYVPTTTTETGKDVTLACNNIPMGYTDTITYKVDGQAVTNPVNMDNTKVGKDVTCTMTSPSTSVTFSNPTSAPGKLPTIITNIQSVFVTVEGDILTEVADKSTNPTLQMTCIYSPDAIYLSVAPPVYAWQKDGTDIPNEKTDTYSPKVSGTYNITCSATLGSQPTVASSNKVKVTLSDTYIDAPILRSSATKPIKGGRVILTCGDDRSDIVSYMWYGGAAANVMIDRQYDRKLQIDNFDTTDDAIYKCQIVKNLFIADSNTVDLKTQTKIETPTISVIGCGTRLAENGDYWLSCGTSSETIGMTYVWTVGGKTSSVTSKYYSLPAITSSNNGDYICAATFGSVTSSNSATKTVEVTDPGMLCYHDNICIAAKTGYSGTCDVNDRCLCSGGYTQKGEQCISNTGGALQIVGSILTITAASILSRFI